MILKVHQKTSYHAKIESCYRGTVKFFFYRNVSRLINLAVYHVRQSCKVPSTLIKLIILQFIDPYSLVADNESRNRLKAKM